ncbi:unnamed protein product [Victoria cruziana]
MTAHRAFQFCKQYKRTTEFRRLCEIIRNHLTNLNKYRDQRDRPDLSVPESLQLYLDTRFEQLKVATELELWQEAFRSVEDIHGLMCMVKKTPKPSLMAVYYAKLTEIFWVSDSHLYHAYAWYKLYVLQKSFNKNLTQRDLQLMASSVLLAALSVTPYDHKDGAAHFELENEKERNLRISILLNFSLDSKRDNREVLSRSALLNELVSKGVLTYVPQEVKELYHFLENEFLPLDLASKIEPLLSKLAKLGDKLSSASPVPEVQLSQYIPSLEKLATLRVLKQVSQVYQTMKIGLLSRMIPFFSFSVVEKISVEAVKYNFLPMKVDHLKGVVLFDSMDLESDTLRNHLVALAKRLNKARGLIYPIVKVSRLSDLLPDLVEVIDKEHRRLLARKSIIEKRKEDQERYMLEKERQESSKRLKLQKITEEAEKLRLASEYSQREEQRRRREIEERELEEAQALLQEAEKRKGKKGKKSTIEGVKVTKQAILEMALNEQVKERQEMEKKLQKIAKTMDYLERAKREEEAPLIEEAYRQRLKDEEIFFERQQKQAIDQSKQQHAGDLQEKSRLSRMKANKDIFEQELISRRQDEFERLKRERDERIAMILAERRQERLRQRKIIFYRREEAARLTRLREEEEARKREEAERKRREEAEHRAKLDEIAEKQRQRERELEEKERARRGTLLGKSSDESRHPRPPEPSSAKPAEPAAPSTSSTPGKYVPRFRRPTQGDGGGGAGAAAAAPPPEPDRWGRSDDRPPRTDDRRPFPISRSTSSWSASRRY